MKKIALLILAALLVFALVACQSIHAGSAATGTPVTADPGASDAPDIGISLPGKDQFDEDRYYNPSRPWEQDGQDIKKQLEVKGYTVELMCANSLALQISQIREMVTKGCKVLVISPYENGGQELRPVLAEAKAAGVTVMSYLNLIENTADVDYYVGFDIFRRSALQGEYIEKALGLKDGKGPFNIELFAGSPDDGNIKFFYEGAMSILRPYIEGGQLVVKSGQIDMMEVCTLGYKSEKAKARMDDLLARYYTRDKLDAVLALTDSIASGVIASLEDAGYTRFPFITGMDCEKPNVIAMKAGKQSMSVFLDTRIPAAKAVEMVDAVMTGRQVPLTGNDHYSNGEKLVLACHNGIKVVPSFLCDPAVVTVDNIQQVLIGGGYYTEADLKG